MMKTRFTRWSLSSGSLPRRTWKAITVACQRNPLVANLNLVQSLIVHPEAGGVIEQIREYPSAVGRDIDEAASPFFGANAVVRSRKL
jgi:hypothetical protein